MSLHLGHLGKLVVFMFLSLTSLSSAIPLAHADWNNQSLSWSRMFSSGPVLFPNAYIIEAWSSLQAQSVRDAHLHIESVPSSKFGSGRFKVALQTKRTDTLRILKAPLVLFLPGLYDNMDDHSPMRSAAFLSERGYHVVIPSSSWSQEFIKEDPHFDPGELEQEAGVALDALDYAIKRIGKENITQISIAGESYGAILAAVAFEKDQERAHPLIDGTATLYSPPLDMQNAIDNLDQGSDATENFWDSQCSSIKDLLADYSALSCHPSQDPVSAELSQCSGPLVYHSFQSSLVSAIELLHNIKHLGIIPTAKAALAQWKHDLRFENAIQSFTPENIKILAEGKGLLSYWVALLPGDALARLRIISTQDDLLNQGLSWDLDSGGPFTFKNVILLPWGGHTGYENLPVFQKLLNVAFKNPPQSF